MLGLALLLGAALLRSTALPPVLVYALHMRPFASPHLRLTLESMRRNPAVLFLLVNILDQLRCVRPADPPPP